MKRYDERDNIFSRMARKPGTSQYENYYSNNPDKEIIDNKLRSSFPIGVEGDRFFDSLKTPTVDAAFNLLFDLRKLVTGNEKNSIKTKGSREDYTKLVKEIANLYGASNIGITKSDLDFYYSFRGRNDDVYGEIVDNNILPKTLVFAIPMNKEMVKKAPRVEESMATTQGYVQSAIVALMITYSIQQLGFNARAHIDGNYLNILPIAAEKAGIGKLGMHGLLITEEYGPRVRLSAVSTDMPLIYDEVINKNQKEICDNCMKCVKSCPSKAISEVFGEPINQEKCFGKWLEYGTDCGICLSVCSSNK